MKSFEEFLDERVVARKVPIGKSTFDTKIAEKKAMGSYKTHISKAGDVTTTQHFSDDHHNHATVWEHHNTSTGQKTYSITKI
jgi:hypothetical protein